MLYPLLAVLFGTAALIWSADRFVQGAAAMAKNLGMSVFIIGLTIVALGTSAPEIIISSSAALSGSPGLAIGNALGSNIANIGLVLGITALIAPLCIQPQVLREDIPILIVISLVAGLLLFDERLDQWDGYILIAMLLGYLYFLFRHKTKIAHAADSELISHELEEEIDEQHLSSGQAFFYFISGLVVLLGSAKILVWGAQEIALAAGIDEAIIGLTLVALGTSLPELAASISSTLKGHHDLAVGNIIGSNIFNLLTVLPMPALLAPSDIPAATFSRDFSTLFLLTVLLLLLPLLGKKQYITATKGIVLLALYIGYYAVLYQSEMA